MIQNAKYARRSSRLQEARVRAEVEHMPAARTKQHEEEETRIRTERKNRWKQREARQKGKKIALKAAVVA